MASLVGSWGRVEVLAEGTGNGLAVLLHAAGAGPRALSRLAGELRTAVGRTLVPALPGTVVDSTSTHGMALHDQVEIARAALATAEGEARILFGHSFGGLIAVLTLLEGTEVDAVVLYEPIVMSCLDPGDQQDLSARAWDRELIDYLAECTETHDPEPGVARFVEAYNEVTWHDLPEGPRKSMVRDAGNMVALTRAVHHLSLDRARLRELSVPVLVMYGNRSPVVAQLMSIRLGALLPNARLEQITGVGHMAPSLAPECLCRPIASFLASNRAGRSDSQSEL